MAREWSAARPISVTHNPVERWRKSFLTVRHNIIERSPVSSGLILKTQRRARKESQARLI